MSWWYFTVLNIALMTTIAICVCCFCGIDRRLPAIAAGTASGSSNQSSRGNRGRPVDSTNASEGAQEIDPATLRAKVVRAILPEQIIDDNSILVYNADNRSYCWTNSRSGTASCAICLENFAPGDVTITTQCSHVFHRDCVFGWLVVHDECPECRQFLWDFRTYRRAEVKVHLMLKGQSV